jgi:hypothetical protein
VVTKHGVIIEYTIVYVACAFSWFSKTNKQAFNVTLFIGLVEPSCTLTWTGLVYEHGSDNIHGVLYVFLLQPNVIIFFRSRIPRINGPVSLTVPTSYQRTGNVSQTIYDP